MERWARDGEVGEVWKRGQGMEDGARDGKGTRDGEAAPTHLLKREDTNGWHDRAHKSGVAHATESIELEERREALIWQLGRERALPKQRRRQHVQRHRPCVA